MTPTELRVLLATVLSGKLGTYKDAAGSSMGAALRVGDPPSDWTVTGLEAVITIDPDFGNVPLQGSESNLRETLLLRLVAHEASSKLQEAVRLVVRRFSDASVATVPANSSLGILHQVVIRIPK